MCEFFSHGKTSWHEDVQYKTYIKYFEQYPANCDLLILENGKVALSEEKCVYRNSVPPSNASSWFCHILFLIQPLQIQGFLILILILIHDSFCNLATASFPGHISALRGCTRTGWKGTIQCPTKSCRHQARPALVSVSKNCFEGI